MENLIPKAARDIAASRQVVALTGAGISVESGIPPFRGKGGVWEKFDPMEFAHIDAFMQDPAKVWRTLIGEMKRTLDTARPNDAHRGLARLESLGYLKTVITQNVDGLHQMAGNSDVIEFHGSFAVMECLQCRREINTAEVTLDEMPPKCSCGGILRPACVFFGELIPTEHLTRSQAIASQCDLMLVVGTSAVVQPAAFMPVIAKQSGARVIEINPESTPLTHTTSDYLLKGRAGEMMNGILAELDLAD